MAKAVNQERVTDIWLLLNGSRVEKSRGIKVVGREEKTVEGLRAEIDLTLQLTQETNRISVAASNRHTTSEPETIEVTWKKDPLKGGAADHYKPDLYLLAIGASEYQDGDYRLGYAAADATGLARELERQAGRLYGKVNTKALTDRDATRENILEALDWILKESTQKDTSVIFVAGHGMNDDGGNYYFLPWEGDAKKLRSTGVKWFDFQDILTRLPSKGILMVDTCHSGSVTGKRREELALAKKRGPDVATDMTNAVRELLEAGPGVVVLTASTGKESSQERTEWGHGAFTKALIEGLEGKANYDEDDAVTIKELDLYITNRVKELTDGAQHPTTEVPKTMPNFPVAVK